MKDIEKLTEETLRSIDDIREAPVNPYLFGKIQNRMREYGQRAARDKRIAYRLTAVLLLLMMINLASFFLLRKGDTANAAKTSGIEAFYKDYNLQPNSYNY